MTMMTVEAPQNEVYDPDDVGLRDSPLLKPHKPKLEPTPSPPPEFPESEDSPPPQSPKSRKNSKRLKPVPSQGDAVLIGLLGGGKALEEARTAGRELLPSDDEMSDGSQKGVDVKASMDVDTPDSNNDLAALAMGALKVHAAHVATTPTESAHPNSEEVVATAPTSSPPTMNGNDGHGQVQQQPLAPMATDSTNQAMRHLSPNISGPKSADELAPIQQPSPKSEKSNNFTLPSIAAQLGDLTQLAEAATATATASKDPPGEHRLSISHSHSPPGPPLFSAVPGSQQGGHGSPPISPNDNFRRELPSPGRGSVAAASPYYYNNPRRPSQASEGPPYPAATPGDYGGSSTETPSTDQSGSTPAGIPAGIDRMSIDNMTNPQIGGFQCRYPGCNAQPFQTQYLLNSHANVHSSNRPHYCPVKGCPRAEGGKGFKRKNEMIRHGLVHESPGYVCPYCQDREHKYPRPDNLQRHVRVHHVDKDKDDPLLREVLAQRPEGPSRGRRRRGGNS